MNQQLLLRNIRFFISMTQCMFQIRITVTYAPNFDGGTWSVRSRSNEGCWHGMQRFLHANCKELRMLPPTSSTCLCSAYAEACLHWLFWQWLCLKIANGSVRIPHLWTVFGLALRRQFSLGDNCANIRVHMLPFHEAFKWTIDQLFEISEMFTLPVHAVILDLFGGLLPGKDPEPPLLGE